MKSLLAGAAVDFDALQNLEAPRVAEFQDQDIPATQVLPGAAQPPAGSVSMPGQGSGSSALTQAGAGLAVGEEEDAPLIAGGSRKRLRAEPELTAEDFTSNGPLKGKVIMSVLETV